MHVKIVSGSLYKIVEMLCQGNQVQLGRLERIMYNTENMQELLTLISFLP